MAPTFEVPASGSRQNFFLKNFSRFPYFIPPSPYTVTPLFLIFRLGDNSLFFFFLFKVATTTTPGSSSGEVELKRKMVKR